MSVLADNKESLDPKSGAVLLSSTCTNQDDGYNSRFKRLLKRESLEWDRCRLHEFHSISKGKNVKIDEKKVLQKVAPDVGKYVDIVLLLPYLQKRGSFFTPGDECELKCLPNPVDRANKFLNVMMRLVSGSSPILPDLLLSLLDSYEASDGGEAHHKHWTFVQMLLNAVYSCQGSVYQEPDFSSVLETIRGNLGKVKVGSEEEFAAKLGLTVESPCSYEDILLLKQKEGIDLETLVHSLVCTPGLGRLVSDIHPPCRCNPPDVHNWFKRLPPSAWRIVALHFGFSTEEIRCIDNTFHHDVGIIPQILLRTIRIPECGWQSVHDLNDIVSFPETKDSFKALPFHFPGEPVSEHSLALQASRQTHAPGNVEIENVLKSFKNAAAGTDGRSTDCQHDYQWNFEYYRKSHRAGSECDKGSAEETYRISLTDRSGTPDTQLSRSANAAEMRQPSPQPCQESQPEDLPLAEQVENYPELLMNSKTEQEVLLYPETEVVMNDGTELLNACKEKDWDLALTLLQTQSNFVEACCKNDGMTALHYACDDGAEEVIDKLVDQGADVSFLNKQRCSVLHYSKVLHNENILRRLLTEFVQKNLSVDSSNNSNHDTPLLLVCNEGDKLCTSAEMLLDARASPDGSRYAHSRPLIVACAGRHRRLVELLISKGVNLDAQDKNGNTALLQACKMRDFNIAQYLLEQPEININRSDKSGTTPLFEAISANNYETVLQLLERGARVNATRQVSNAIMMGSVEETPLAHACARGFEKLINLLIDHGANVNFKCSDTVPPIGFAIICGHMNVVRMLLKCNSLDVSVYGLTGPIIIAVKVENFGCTKLLIDKLGGTEKALQLATNNQLDELATHIIQYSTADPVRASLQEKLFHQTSQVAIDVSAHSGQTNAVLQTFCHICVLAVRESEVQNGVSLKDIASTARVICEENQDVANFFIRVANNSQSPSDLRRDFLGGSPSPLTFLINQNILTCAGFVIQALQYHDNEPDEFYNDLITAFHTIPGGENLPHDIQNVLNRLFNQQFIINLRVGHKGFCSGDYEDQLPVPGYNHHPQVLPSNVTSGTHPGPHNSGGSEATWGRGYVLGTDTNGRARSSSSNSPLPVPHQVPTQTPDGILFGSQPTVSQDRNQFSGMFSVVESLQSAALPAQSHEPPIAERNSTLAKAEAVAYTNNTHDSLFTADGSTHGVLSNSLPVNDHTIQACESPKASTNNCPVSAQQQVLGNQYTSNTVLPTNSCVTVQSGNQHGENNASPSGVLSTDNSPPNNVAQSVNREQGEESQVGSSDLECPTDSQHNTLDLSNSITKSPHSNNNPSIQEISRQIDPPTSLNCTNPQSWSRPISPETPEFERWEYGASTVDKPSSSLSLSESTNTVPNTSGLQHDTDSGYFGKGRDIKSGSCLEKTSTVCQPKGRLCNEKRVYRDQDCTPKRKSNIPLPVRQKKTLTSLSTVGNTLLVGEKTSAGHRNIQHNPNKSNSQLDKNTDSVQQSRSVSKSKITPTNTSRAHPNRSMSYSDKRNKHQPLLASRSQSAPMSLTAVMDRNFHNLEPLLKSTDTIQRRNGCKYVLVSIKPVTVLESVESFDQLELEITFDSLKTYLILMCPEQFDIEGVDRVEIGLSFQI